MKKLLFISLTVLTQHLVAQTSVCCSPNLSPEEQFASLANDPAFVRMHENPAEFKYIPGSGKTITYECPDGQVASAFFIKAESESNNYLIVVHEWWGLNDYIRQTSEQLFNDLGGVVNILAVDLYDGKVTSDNKEAGAMMQELSPERALAIISGAINYAGNNARIATIGWCMGGGYSLQASIMAGEEGVGCVMYYGYPESDLEKLKRLNGDVLMIWASQDKWITEDVVESFKTNMDQLHKTLLVKEYDTDHAFANPSNPHYDKGAASDAYQNALAFLKTKF